MMGAVRSWMLTVIAVSLICALADALMPRGGVKQVGRLVCGLTLIGAILSPIAGLDIEAGRQWLKGYLDGLDQEEEMLRSTVDGQMEVIIEQQCAAYIVDKAAQLGLSCSARVECRRDGEGLYIPVRAEVSGPLTEGGRAQLLRIIAEDLGIPESEQSYIQKEEVP